MKTPLTRAGRTGSPRLSRTARAVRAALFVSAAFALSPAAFAGTCTQTDTNEVTCTGTFTDDVYNSVPPANQVPDLTLILDADTVVTPAAGVNGLTANWGGDVVVISDADISTDGADAIYQYGSNTATLSSYGDLYTYASVASANAVDLSAFGNVYATLGGEIQATGADTYDTTAVHAYSSTGDVAVTTAEGSSINADAYGAVATGLYAGAGIGDVTLTNNGSISASSDVTAIAVELYSNGYTSLYNYGEIAGYGDVYGVAVNTSVGLSSDYIYNAGTITGAIYTGAGDDSLVNAEGAEWNATAYSDFGDGDDTVSNYGTISFDDSGIGLGAYATTAGNLFQNSGTIFANGDSYVDVGAGAGLSTSLFVNDGVIDMRDGAADDSFSVYGDFAGTGDVNVDVEGDAGVADMLYIEGNVAADARQTINVDLLDLSAPISDIIPIVEVSGDSTAANFSLGEVNFDPNDSFVDLDFGLVADIDGTNATPDVFSLGIDVVGLTDTGTIAASIAPSVHSLMQTEVGTWRQRMGVIDSFNDGAVSLWARVFTEKTDFSPEFESSTIGLNGNFDYKQRNRGVEAGVDFAVTDEFSLGLMAAKSKADIDLDPGSADANIEADTWGVYGTWLSPTGFYLDTSYRWTKFDTDIDSLAGPMHIDGAKAETFNVELGYAWTLAGGLKIEPQFQWTKTNVKDLDVLTTANGMTFSSDGADSSRGRLGVAAYKGMGDADTGWRVTPYVALSAVREFDGENDFAINDTLVGRTMRDGTSGLLELAVTARHENLSIWGGVNWQDGGGIDSSIGGQLGVRYTFGGSSPAPAPVPVAVPVAPAKTCADLDDDSDGVNNCDDRCPGSSGTVGSDGCPVPAPQPEPEMAPKPFRG
jgi:outer membrane autotransporter protein